jgi:tetratricopeptide (TPR) repeat protein
LGERLYAAGIEARLDQWFVQPGEAFTAFMEQEVEASDFVLVVCTPSYAHKSNKRQGGVGYEQQIVSGQLMAGIARSKFIPILRKGGCEPGPDCAIPAHFLGIAWIDFRDDEAFEVSLEDLIRVILSKPRFAPPPLGLRPLLETSTATNLNRSSLTESDENIEKGDSVKTDVKEADIDLKSDHAWAYYRRGLAYYSRGDDGRAMAEYNRAIELKPDYADAYIFRGNAYAANGDEDHAIADYTKAIEIAPDEAGPYFYRGNFYFYKGDKDRAIADYTKAIEIMPNFVRLYLYRGAAYSDKGDKDRAIADFRKSLELLTDPSDREDVLQQLRRLGAE